MREHETICQIRQQDGDDVTCTCSGKLDAILDEHLGGLWSGNMKEDIKALMLHIRDLAYLRTDPDINKMMLEFDRLVKKL